MTTVKLNKQEYQKRAIAIQKLAFLLELNQGESISKILSYLVSPIGESKHPYRMTDNEFIGHIEKEIKRIENGEDEE